MINLELSNGILIPNRDYISPISIQEGVRDIRLIENSLLLESGTIKGFIKIFKDIMEKILGMIKEFINKIKGYTTPKLVYIEKNKKAILEFNENSPAYTAEISIPINMLSSNYSVIEFNNIVNTWMSKAYVALENKDPKYDLYDDNSTKIAHKILFEFTKIKTTKMTDEKILNHLYGYSSTTTIGELDIRKVYDTFHQMHNNINNLDSIRKNLNETLTKTQVELEKQQTEVILNKQEFNDISLRYVISVYQGIMTALDFYVKSEIKIYNILYSILEKIINVSK